MLRVRRQRQPASGSVAAHVEKEAGRPRRRSCPAVRDPRARLGGMNSTARARAARASVRDARIAVALRLQQSAREHRRQPCRRRLSICARCCRGGAGAARRGFSQRMRSHDNALNENSQERGCWLRASKFLIWRSASSRRDAIRLFNLRSQDASAGPQSGRGGRR